MISGAFHLGTPKPVSLARVEAMAVGANTHAYATARSWAAAGLGLGAAKDADIWADDAGQIAVAFDGRLYNAAELRTMLTETGEGFDGDGPAELIARLWRHSGPKLLQQLEGKFVIALHDGANQRLFLARDRVGVRTLHLAAMADGALVFSSSLSGLAANPLFRKQINVTALDDYLALGFIADDNCLLAGVHKLPAGHYLIAERGRDLPVPVRWWDAQFKPDEKAGAKAGAPALLETLRASIAQITRPGAAGTVVETGVNSAAIVALMAEASSRAVPTLAIDPGWDGKAQGDAATAPLAERYATAHKQVGLPSEQMLASIDAFVTAFDEPLGDVEALGRFCRTAIAAEHVGDVLAGAGADEFLGDHRLYPNNHILENILNISSKIFKNNRINSISSRVREAAILRAVEARIATSFEARRRLLSARTQQEMGDYRAEQRYFDAMEAASGDPMARAQYADIVIELPANVLRRHEGSAEAAGIALHLPFLSRDMMDFARSQSARARQRGGQGKWLLRRAMAGHLPGEVIGAEARETPPPVAHWLRGPLAPAIRRLADRSALIESGRFDRAELTALIDAHLDGRADHGALLWQLLILDRTLARLFGPGRQAG